MLRSASNSIAAPVMRAETTTGLLSAPGAAVAGMASCSAQPRTVGRSGIRMHRQSNRGAIRSPGAVGTACEAGRLAGIDVSGAFRGR